MLAGVALDRGNLCMATEALGGPLIVNGEDSVVNGKGFFELS